MLNKASVVITGALLFLWKIEDLVCKRGGTIVGVVKFKRNVNLCVVNQKPHHEKVFPSRDVASVPAFLFGK